MTSAVRWFSIVVGLAALAGVVRAEPKANRWEPQIVAFEAADRHNPPPQEGILLVGSSSIRLWNERKWFPDLPVINRGFGGSQIADVVAFAERIVLPYRPKVIVFYAGDNDVAAGKSPEQVAADFQAFVEKVHKALPETRILYIAIKPSLRRWSLIDQIRRANRLIEAQAAQDARLVFVDVEKPMLGPDGKPRPELLADDGLHLSEEGYRLWTSLVRAQLK